MQRYPCPDLSIYQVSQLCCHGIHRLLVFLPIQAQRGTVKPHMPLLPTGQCVGSAAHTAGFLKYMQSSMNQECLTYSLSQYLSAFPLLMTHFNIYQPSNRSLFVNVIHHNFTISQPNRSLCKHDTSQFYHQSAKQITL